MVSVKYRYFLFLFTLLCAAFVQADFQVSFTQTSVQQGGDIAVNWTYDGAIPDPDLRSFVFLLISPRSSESVLGDVVGNQTVNIDQTPEQGQLVYSSTGLEPGSYRVDVRVAPGSFLVGGTSNQIEITPTDPAAFRVSFTQTSVQQGTDIVVNWTFGEPLPDPDLRSLVFLLISPRPSESVLGDVVGNQTVNIDHSPEEGQVVYSSTGLEPGSYRVDVRVAPGAFLVGQTLDRVEITLPGDTALRVAFTQTSVQQGEDIVVDWTYDGPIPDPDLQSLVFLLISPRPSESVLGDVVGNQTVNIDQSSEEGRLVYSSTGLEPGLYRVDVRIAPGAFLVGGTLNGIEITAPGVSSS